MTSNLLSVMELLGGLALFLLGMEHLGRGLLEAAGERLRSLLNGATRRRDTGFLLGLGMGTLAHSSAATVILVGLAHAGLLTLGRTIPAIVGANVGTTLSMQILSFRLDAYAFVPIAAGFFWSILARGERARAAGCALMGFGLLFLGMRIMGGAVHPHRELLAPWLARMDGTTGRGILTGIAVSAAVTLIIQSSGATIGMTFALAGAGVLTDLSQALPIVLGAHVGTCVTALLASLGTHLDAKRTAYSHMFFNLVNAALGAAAVPLLLRWIPPLSGDLTRQIAHVHTVVMILGALLVLPLARPFEAAVRLLVGRNRASPAASHLDTALLAYPEQAMQACMRELQRVLALTLKGMRLSARLFFAPHPSVVRQVAQTKRLLKEVKRATSGYLAALTSGYLSRRQILLAQHLERCMTDVERIGDHVNELAVLSNRRVRYGQKGYVEAESLGDLMEAFRRVARILQWAGLAFDPDRRDRQSLSRIILQARDKHMKHSREIRDRFSDGVAAHRTTPIAALYFHQYLTVLDRMVQHLRLIAISLHHADFRIKEEKLDLPAQAQPKFDPIPAVDPETFLAQLEADLRLPLPSPEESPAAAEVQTS